MSITPSCWTIRTVSTDMPWSSLRFLSAMYRSTRQQLCIVDTHFLHSVCPCKLAFCIRQLCVTVCVRVCAATYQDAARHSTPHPCTRCHHRVYCAPYGMRPARPCPPRNLVWYVRLSMALHSTGTVSVISHAFHVKKQFYPAVVYIASSGICMMVRWVP